MADPFTAERLPLTLRAYQKLSAAIAPLAPLWIERRLKQGKEDAARAGERRPRGVGVDGVQGKDVAVVLDPRCEGVIE